MDALRVRSEQIAALAVRHAVPTIFGFREFAAVGGLMSYGSKPKRIKTIRWVSTLAAFSRVKDLQTCRCNR